MSFFTDSSFYSGPPLTQMAIRNAEQAVGGYKLPRAYLDLLQERNGGKPRRPFIDTDFPVEEDGSSGVCIDVIMGIGASTYMIDDPDCSNAYFISEWDLPDVGVVFCAPLDHGHDAVMFDYRACGRQGEPSVVYTGEDRQLHTIATDFTDFVAHLQEIPAARCG